MQARMQRKKAAKASNKPAKQEEKKKAAKDKAAEEKTAEEKAAQKAAKTREGLQGKDTTRRRRQGCKESSQEGGSERGRHERVGSE